MAKPMDLSAILDLAIQREEEAYRFYGDVAKRMKNAAVKEAFTQLAKDELGHKAFLQGCLKDPKILGKLPVPADYKIAEATSDPELSVDMKPAAAMALAMKKEQSAAEFYQGLARAATDAALKATFEGLAKMELGHKVRIEEMFVNVGYPEVF